MGKNVDSVLYTVTKKKRCVHNLCDIYFIAWPRLMETLHRNYVKICFGKENIASI